MAKKPIVVKDILDLLADNKDRKQINEIYGLNPAEAKMVWADSRLKGVKKAKYSIGIELVNDVVDNDITNDVVKAPFLGEQSS